VDLKIHQAPTKKTLWFQNWKITFCGGVDFSLFQNTQVRDETENIRENAFQLTIVMDISHWNIHHAGVKRKHLDRIEQCEQHKTMKEPLKMTKK